MYLTNGIQQLTRLRIYVITIALAFTSLHATIAKAQSPFGVPSETVYLPLTMGKTGLFSLSTEEQLKLVEIPPNEPNELALRLVPELESIPPAPFAAANYEVGTIIPFTVTNLTTSQNVQISAELVYRTEVAYVWVEVNQSFDLENIVQSVNNFSQEIYPKMTAFFGRESSPGIDSDSRLHILHTIQTGSNVGGYFSSIDVVSSVVYPSSNEKDMFYVNLSDLNNHSNYAYYERLLAHEFQHMIHSAQDRSETNWLNEGLSEYAEEVAGLGPDGTNIHYYMDSPSTQLNTWNGVGSNALRHYGSSYLFVKYFINRFGMDIAKNLIKESANGEEGINQALQDAGASETFTTVFSDWVIANYVDEPTALGGDQKYGYSDLDFRKPTLKKSFLNFPASQSNGSVTNFGVDYFRFITQNVDTPIDVTFTFTGTVQTALAEVTPASGRVSWWSNRSNGMDSRLTRKFDFSGISAGTPIELTSKMWWDIEDGYDYGYALASEDGVKWQILEGMHTTVVNPHGVSFGSAYTSLSGNTFGASSWVTEAYDLSTYAGEEIWIRFEYVTDGGLNEAGWFIDDIQIPAIGYAGDFETGPDGWESEGWLLTDNILQQEWLVQLFTLQGSALEAVYKIPVDANGNAEFDIPTLGNGRSAVITISGATIGTTEPASYSFSLE